MVHAQITIIVILSLVYVCNASTLGLYNRNEKILSRSNSPGVQHWIYPNSRSGNGFNLNQFGLGIFNTLLGQGNPFAEPEPDSNPTQSGDSRIVDGVINALGPGQDPSPISRVESDGQRHYYFPTSDFNRGVYIQTSTNLNTILSKSTNEYSVFNFTSQIGPEAPALYEWDANNYLLYVSSVGADGNGYMYVLHNDGQDLLNGWQNLGPVKYGNGDPIINYDGYAFTHPNGNHYLLYSGLHYILLSRLDGFTQLAPRSEEVVVVPARTVNGNSPVIEAPGAYVRGNTLNVFYSENGFFDPAYNTLNIAIDTSLDPLQVNNWLNKSTKTTILKSNSKTGVYGPGSGGTFIGPDSQPWFAYTCFYEKDGFDQTKVNPRRVQAQPLSFNEDDVMVEIIPDRPLRYVSS